MILGMKGSTNGCPVCSCLLIFLRSEHRREWGCFHFIFLWIINRTVLCIDTVYWYQSIKLARFVARLLIIWHALALA